MRKAEGALELTTPVRKACLASCCCTGVVQAAEEGAEGFRATVHRSEDGRKIVAFEPKSDETVLVVVGPKGAHDGVEAGAFGDEQGAFVTLPQLTARVDDAATDRHSGREHGRGEHGFVFGAPKACEMLDHVVEALPVGPAVVQHQPVLKVGQDLGLQASRKHPLVEGQALPSIQQTVHAVHTGLWQRVVGRPSLWRPTCFHIDQARKNRRQHGHRKVVDEGLVFLTGRAHGVEIDGHDWTVVEHQADVSGDVVLVVGDHGCIDAFGVMDGDAIHGRGGEREAGAFQHVIQPAFWRRGIPSCAHESGAPREEVEATPSMLFPGQHAEGDVAVVLQAGEVGLLSVASADVRTAAKG